MTQDQARHQHKDRISREQEFEGTEGRTRTQRKERHWRKGLCSIVDFIALPQDHEQGLKPRQDVISWRRRRRRRAEERKGAVTCSFIYVMKGTDGACVLKLRPSLSSAVWFSLQCPVLPGNMTLLPPTPSDSCPRTHPAPPRRTWRAAEGVAAAVLGNKREYFRHVLSWSSNLPRGKCFKTGASLPASPADRAPGAGGRGCWVALWRWCAVAVRGCCGGRGRGTIWPEEYVLRGDGHTSHSYIFVLGSRACVSPAPRTISRPPGVVVLVAGVRGARKVMNQRDAAVQGLQIWWCLRAGLAGGWPVREAQVRSADIRRLAPGWRGFY